MTGDSKTGKTGEDQEGNVRDVARLQEGGPLDGNIHETAD